MSVSIAPSLKQTLRDDGVAKIPGLLDSDQLAQIQSCYEWSLANPGPLYVEGSDEWGVTTVDNFNPKSLDVYRETLIALPIADVLRETWDSEHVWYYAEEIFRKENNSGRTVWHQDLAYLPWAGEHWANSWITFQSIPKSHSLEVIRSSHHGTLYNGSSLDPDNPTLPLWGDAVDFPRLPDIEAERKVDPESWDVVSFDVDPGDVVFLHPGSLHGGAPVDKDVPVRDTLVLRFFGDDATWTDLPEAEGLLTEDQAKVTLPPWVKRGRPGEPVGGPQFLQLY